ncbi:hypothetical protein ACFL2T_04150, partial [Elusimicrobiota bacterium]
YQPPLGNTPGKALPFDALVVPFEDATPSYKKEGRTFNVAKTGFGQIAPALPPESLANFFAQHLEASGTFRKVRFAFDPAPAPGEVLVSGKVKRADYDMEKKYLLTLEVEFRASRRGSVMWDKTFSRHVNVNIWSGGTVHRSYNDVTRKLFVAAEKDLRASLGSGPKRGGGSAGEPGTTVEDILQSIQDD